MARHIPTGFVLIAMLAGCWAAQVAAQAQDATTQSAAYSKHKKHGKYEHHDKHYGGKYEHDYYGPEYGYEQGPEYVYGPGYGPGGLPLTIEADLELSLDAYYDELTDNDWQQWQDAYCDAKDGPDGYGYNKLGDGDVITPVLSWYSAWDYADYSATECYGQPAVHYYDIYASVYPGSVSSTVGQCDKDLAPLADTTSPWALESYGPAKALIANLKIPIDSSLATTNSYYNELDGTICGVVYLYEGVGFYGSEAALPFLNAFSRTTDPETPPVYGYFGSVTSVVEFDSADVDLPNWIYCDEAGPEGCVSRKRSAQRRFDDSTLEDMCKNNRASLPVFEYGKVDIRMRRYTSEQLAEILEGLNAENPRYTARVTAGRKKRAAAKKPAAKKVAGAKKPAAKKAVDAKKP